MTAIGKLAASQAKLRFRDSKFHLGQAISSKLSQWIRIGTFSQKWMGQAPNHYVPHQTITDEGWWSRWILQTLLEASVNDRAHTLSFWRFNFFICEEDGFVTLLAAKVQQFIRTFDSQGLHARESSNNNPAHMIITPLHWSYYSMRRPFSTIAIFVV